MFTSVWVHSHTTNFYRCLSNAFSLGVLYRFSGKQIHERVEGKKKKENIIDQ